MITRSKGPSCSGTLVDKGHLMWSWFYVILVLCDYSITFILYHILTQQQQKYLFCFVCFIISVITQPAMQLMKNKHSNKYKLVWPDFLVTVAVLSGCGEQLLHC